MSSTMSFIPKRDTVDKIIKIMQLVFSAIIIESIMTVFDVSLDQFASVLAIETQDQLYHAIKLFSSDNHDFYIFVWKIIHNRNFMSNVLDLLTKRYNSKATDVILTHQRRLLSFKKKCKDISKKQGFCITIDEAFALFREFGIIITSYLQEIECQDNYKPRAPYKTPVKKPYVEHDITTVKKQVYNPTRHLRGKDKRIAKESNLKKLAEDKIQAHKLQQIQRQHDMVKLDNQTKIAIEELRRKREREDAEDAHLSWDDWVTARDWRWNEYVQWQKELRSCGQSYEDF